MLWWTLLKLRWGPAQARMDAAVELGNTRDARAVDPLISALTRDSDLCGEVATALGKIGDPRAADALMGLLLDERAATRSAAVWALGKVGDGRAVGPLAAVLATDGDADVCEAAAEALVRLGDARGVVRGVPPLVLATRHHPQEGVLDHESICELLVQAGAPAVPPLVELLQHGDPDVQEVATRALAQLGDASAVVPLAAVLQSGGVSIRRAAAEALAKLGSVRAAEALVTALGDQDPDVRKTSASLLARSGPRVVEPLVLALGSGDSVRRREAAKVLALLRAARAVEPLVAATEDPVEEVRWAAANALLAIGDRGAIEALVRQLMRGDVVPPGYLHALLGSLRRSIHNLPVEVLAELAHLESVMGPPARNATGVGSASTGGSRVDCSEFRQLARRELSRRGIQAHE